MNREEGPVLSMIRAWLANPVLLEWDESPAWCELAGRRDLARSEKWARVLACRALPEGLVVFALGFWVLRLIPGNEGLPSWRLLAYAGGLLLLCLVLPLAALRTGLIRVPQGVGARIRLRRRTFEIRGSRGTVKIHGWSRFEAFDFGLYDGFQVLKLRARDSWPLRGHRPAFVVAFEVVGPPELLAAVREVLCGSGLHEEPLGEPS